MIDYSQYEKAIATPHASSLIETFRAIGYSVETALADIIDNSISANCSNVWIDFGWKGADSWISVLDDGRGMNNEELIEAMRPGSKNPLAERDAKDLGRFGLGLKTASFSQCRQLTVASKMQQTKVVYWTWDLDFVSQGISNSWELVRYIDDEAKLQLVNNLNSGTLVIWNKIDRIVKNERTDDERARDKFLATIESIERHISMVFHKYIEAEHLSIWIRGRKIIAWNPFLENESATQIFPNEILVADCKIKGYVLPHRNRISSEVYETAKGPKDSWTMHQGFYVYRNNRLLVAGDWLGLFKREHHYDLCRIAIEIPNRYDSDWQIDIKKSVARPPSFVRDQVVGYAKKVRATALEVYKHRGKVIKRSISTEVFKPVWLERIRSGKRQYEINKEHPIVAELLDGLDTENRSALQKLLKYVEQTVPVDLINYNVANRDIENIAPFEFNSIDIASDIKRMYHSLLEKGNSDEQAKQALFFIEPFDHYPELILKVSEK